MALTGLNFRAQVTSESATSPCRLPQVDGGGAAGHLGDEAVVEAVHRERPHPDHAANVALALGARLDVVRGDAGEVPHHHLAGSRLRRREALAPHRHGRLHLLAVEVGHHPAPALSPVDGPELRLQGILGGALQLRVHGDVHHQALGLHALGAVPLVEILAHGVGVPDPGAVVDPPRQGEGPRRLAVRHPGRHEPLLGHAPEHVPLPLLGGDRVLHGREALGRLDQPGDHRRFTHRELRHALAEVEARGLLHPVAAVPEVDLVQVEVEDLVLAEVPFQAPRQHQLLHLASEVALRAEEEGLHHLLGDGGAAAVGVALQDVLHRAARDGEVVHPLVLVEMGVLGRQDRLLHHQRDLVEGHHRAPLAGEGEHLAAVARVDARGDERPVVPEGLEGGEGVHGGHAPGEPRAAAAEPHRGHHQQGAPGAKTCPGALPVLRGALGASGAGGAAVGEAA